MSARASAYAKALVVCPNGESITPREKLVLIVLADNHQDKAKHFTYPAIETIAEDALCDRRSCQRYLASLERKGVIVRRRPPNQGRGMQIFYFFTELDQVPEGWQPAALFDASLLPEKGGRRAAEGRQKGGNSRAALVERAQEQEPEQEQEQVQPPLPPSLPKGAREAEIWRAVDQVSSALGIAENQRRKRRMLFSAVERACEKGDAAPTVALGMIAAVREQDRLHLLGQLKFKFGLGKFVGLGIWREENRWGWDPQEMRRQAAARVGS